MFLCTVLKNMNRKFSVQGLGLVLGVVYGVLTHRLEAMPLVSAFYSIYMGWVWDAIPRISQTEALSWRHVFPPLVLVILMMVASNSNVGPNAEWVSFTAMALIHLRAAVLSSTRLGGAGLGFTLMQVVGFVIPMVYLFQSRFMPIEFNQTICLSIATSLSIASMVVLNQMKRKVHVDREDSRVLS